MCQVLPRVMVRLQTQLPRWLCVSGPPTCDIAAVDSVAEVVVCQVLLRVMVRL